MNKRGMIFDALVMLMIAACLLAGVLLAGRRSGDSAVLNAIGNRPHVVAFEQDGELWYAAAEDGVVLIDQNAMRLLGTGAE